MALTWVIRSSHLVTRGEWEVRIMRCSLCWLCYGRSCVSHRSNFKWCGSNCGCLMRKLIVKDEIEVIDIGVILSRCTHFICINDLISGSCVGARLVLYSSP